MIRELRHLIGVQRVANESRIHNGWCWYRSFGVRVGVKSVTMRKGGKSRRRRRRNKMADCSAEASGGQVEITGKTRKA